MVCPRCILSVENELKAQQIPFRNVQLGEITLDKKLTEKEIRALSERLSALGFELLNDPASRLIDKVKTLLIQKVQVGIEDHFSITKFLSSGIYKDYSAISKLFSSVEGMTIEQYFILQKIEKAKEFLIYDEMSLSDIALFLGYSSTQHLSSQFKRVTGMTPTSFKSAGHNLRRPIDSL